MYRLIIIPLFQILRKKLKNFTCVQKRLFIYYYKLPIENKFEINIINNRYIHSIFST